MENIKLYRRRFIPDEKIYLKDDILIRADEEVVITKWNVLNKRHDFSHGASCYFLKEGFKVSKFIDDDNNLLYWYCDIIDVEKNCDGYTFNDLLVDVVVYEDGFVKVLDIDEIAYAIKNNIITTELACKALEGCDKLLNIIYNDKFDRYKSYIKEI